MSGPPKFRDRDPTASLTGAIDSLVVVQLIVWAIGALWVCARLSPSLLRWRIVPAVNSSQVIGALLIAGLSLSLWHSPGLLLTAFTLGQYTVTLSFAWLFAGRFGRSTYLRHLFAGVCVLTLMLIVAAVLTPDVVFAGTEQRFRGERIASAGAVAVMGLVFCLSDAPRLPPVSFGGAFVLFGALLVTSRMRTAYIAMIIYLAIGYAFGRRLRVRTLVPLLLVVSLGFLALDAFTPTANYLVRETNTLESMSDRIPLWEHLTTAVMRDDPLIGLGYVASSRVLAPQYNEALGNAHSVFFEILVGGGLVGAALYLVLCASLLWYAGRLLAAARGQPEAIAAVGLFAVTLVLGITNSEALLAGPISFSFWSMTALLPAMCREAATRDAMAPRRLPVRGPAAVQPATERGSLST
jgi:O-antigen ligase